MTTDTSAVPAAPRPEGGAHGEEADALVAQIVLTPQGRQDPYPLYQRLREIAPVHHSAMGMWLVSAYDDVNAMLRDRRMGRDAPLFIGNKFGGDWDDHAALRRMAASMLWKNPPEHSRLRNLVKHAFTPRRVAEMKESVAGLVDEMLDPLAEAGGGDLLNDFAFPLPLAVITTLLGVPTEEAPALREPMRAFQQTFDIAITPEQLRQADEGAEFTDSYFTDLIAQRRAHPRDDMISALIEAEDAGDRLTAQELLVICNTVVGAGFETATNTISNMVLALHRNPDQERRVREDRTLVETAVDEVLRCEPPIHLLMRTSLEDVVVGGREIPRHQTVIAMLASANRDPGYFPDPDRFDVGRQDASHLSFGAGVHHCLGWSLAKLEADLTLARLLERFTRIEVTEEPEYRPLVTMRGMKALQVKVTNR
ncbi:cytochrome P450 [Pseudonocardia sp. MH-G8]|uniref:cytochrome P450 n=1 Tax=Pseudonocardia sp. MH-G8 TaxID=1854588 RepID=UPI000BA1295A|nr:cytochrome P450 [Pseudonocardia sp. MH-G8]OZM83076.1 cytochrome P450 [Pseudonocardia sp. MH-G8]